MKTLEDYQCWAVQITRKDGSKVLAVGDGAARSLHWRRAEALKLADRLSVECFFPRRRLRAIRVRVVISEAGKAGKSE